MSYYPVDIMVNIGVNMIFVMSINYIEYMMLELRSSHGLNEGFNKLTLKMSELISLIFYF